MPSRAAAALLALLLLPTRRAAAEEWYEAYQAGLAALKRGDHARAVGRLRRAIALRPEPGRNVLTYGTNVEARYYPYLRLAEASLALGQLDNARQALELSTSWGREPADERARLTARLEAAAPQRPPPTASPEPTPPPTPSPPPPSEPAAPLPATPASATPSPLSTSVPPSAPAPPAPVTRPSESGLKSEPRDEGAPHEVPRQEATTGTLVIVSQPRGALVYLDDELLGSTDPQSGRLVKTDVAAGPHRIRVSSAGHEDTSLEVEVPRGGSAVLPAHLAPATAAASDRGRLLAFAAAALVVAVLVAWIALRWPERRQATAWGATPPPMKGSVAATPSSPVTPGARRDEMGREWFGEYRLLELLGRGGMASVYRAERRSEQVALKRPLASFLDDPDFVQRFAREAEISRSMNHPNIVRILERGEVEGVPYFTMELLSGEPLQAVIRKRGAAEPRVAAALVAQVAEALDFAHSKGVVHRDLKPSNIMLLPEGTAKVMDFGIARGRSFEGLTLTGAFLGTPDYVAPETIEGQGADARSDLYALGMVFYELLAGRLPFVGEPPFALLKRRLAEDPPPPSSIASRVPAELDAIVLRLLRRSPAERPASAEELVVALREWLNRAA